MQACPGCLGPVLLSTRGMCRSHAWISTVCAQAVVALSPCGQCYTVPVAPAAEDHPAAGLSDSLYLSSVWTALLNTSSLRPSSQAVQHVPEPQPAHIQSQFICNTLPASLPVPAAGTGWGQQQLRQGTCAFVPGKLTAEWPCTG